MQQSLDKQNVCYESIRMLIRLWPEVESDLKRMADEPQHKLLKLSAAKLANSLLAKYFAAKNIPTKKHK